MPTYQYECSQCGDTFDVFQSMLDKKLKKCRKCKKNSLIRLIGAGGGLIFKGNGFYETDYKKSTPPKSKPKAKDKASGCPVKDCPHTCAKKD